MLRNYFISLIIFLVLGIYKKNFHLQTYSCLKVDLKEPTEFQHLKYDKQSKR